jgi:hypothetical protein
VCDLVGPDSVGAAALHTGRESPPREEKEENERCRCEEKRDRERGEEG